MKPRDNDNWSGFFRAQHELLRESEQMIRDAERRMDEVRQETVTTGEGKMVHRITAKTWKDRWRLFRVFTRVGWSILFRGQASMAIRKPLP